MEMNKKIKYKNVPDLFPPVQLAHTWRQTAKPQRKPPSNLTSKSDDHEINRVSYTEQNSFVIKITDSALSPLSLSLIGK